VKHLARPQEVTINVAHIICSGCNAGRSVATLSLKRRADA
jgi:hypothetical protein